MAGELRQGENMRREMNTIPRRVGAPLSVAALLSLAALPAVAADNQKVDDMVITASRSEERAIDVPMTTQVITKEMIELSGVTDLGDLIGKYVTGHLHKYTGILTTVGMRGFRSDAHGADLAGYIMLLIDGHRIGSGNSAKIDMDKVERVEIIKGPSSALYGAGALGGVINVITKKGQGDLKTSLDANYGSFDYSKAGVTLEGDVNDKFSAYIHANIEKTGDIDVPTYGTVYNSEVEKKNIGGNLTYAINDEHEIRIGGTYSDLTSESPRLAEWHILRIRPMRPFRNNDKSAGYADMEYNGDYLDGKLHWKGLLYYLYDKNHWNHGSVDPKSNQSKYVDTTLGTDHQFTYEMNDWNELLVGFTLESMEKKSWSISNYQETIPYTPGLEYENQALFVQDSLDLMDNQLNIIVAARYDRFGMTTKQGETGAYSDLVENEESFSHVSPKIGASYKLMDEMIRLRANVGEGFKAPTANQLSADYFHSTYGTHYVGNPDLDPETSLTYEAGVDFYINAFSLQLGYFHSDYKDKIVASSYVDSNGVSSQTWKNSDDAELEGFEVGLEWAVNETLNLPFSLQFYSNMVFNTTKKDITNDEDLQYVSDYEIKSGINCKAGKLSTQLSHVLIGPQMITNYDSYPYSDEEKDSFDFWDLTLKYQVLESLEARASILNLFDQEVEWVRGYLMAERTFRVGLTYTF